MKAAAFAAMVRIFVTTFDQSAVDWQPVVYALALLSLDSFLVAGGDGTGQWLSAAIVAAARQSEHRRRHRNH